ncbi:hypothetical protein, partial [Capnocytophaga canis]
VIEKDLPVLKEVVSKEWTKENTLNELKNELTSIDRKIQLSITPIKEESEEEVLRKDKEIKNQEIEENIKTKNYENTTHFKTKKQRM